MDKNKVAFCAICNIPLRTIEFNLRSNNSKYSNIPLISIIEHITEKGQFLTQHFDICPHCYDLLNELDAIEVRHTEIQQQLREYFLKQAKNNYETPEEPSENISKCAVNENDASLLSCNDIIENDKVNIAEANELLSETLDLKFDENRSILNAVSDESRCTKVKEEHEQFLNTNKRGKLEVKNNVERNEHSIFTNMHVCQCSKVFATAVELKRHMTAHSDHRAYICEICGQSYKRKAAFNIHMGMHNGINMFTCVYCNKSFTQKVALVRHVPIHTGELPYQCEQCGKRFVHHTSFKFHRLSHSGLRSYKCTLCDVAVMSASHLKRHMRMHSGEKKFSCGICGKKFTERYNLNAHEKLHADPCGSELKKRSFSRTRSHCPQPDIYK